MNEEDRAALVLYPFSFQPYRYPFRQPLKTHHGLWKVREGILLRLVDRTGRIGWGEISPLPWFGSETLAEALTLCQQFGEEVSEEAIAAIPDSLPACQFGLESALHRLLNPNFPSFADRPSRYSYLLPAGETALQTWQPLWNKGGRTFKWKIGVDAIAKELNLFAQLVLELPIGAKLRLDANGGLNSSTVHQWLQASDEAGIVEFIEQPLPPEQFEVMLRLCDRYRTPLALDESVATVRQLQTGYQRGWRGIFIIKAAIAGSPQKLRQFCHTHPIDAVFSSVFETDIGRYAALSLAAELSNPNRALGFGVDSWSATDE